MRYVFCTFESTGQSKNILQLDSILFVNSDTISIKVEKQGRASKDTSTKMSINGVGKMKLLHTFFDLKQNGHLQSAREEITRLAEEQEKNPSILFEAGLLHKNLEIMPQAITYFNQALELDLLEDIRKNSLFHLGACYRAVGLYENAKEAFEIGMSEFPAANEFYIYFAMTLYNMDESDLAMEIVLSKLLETTKDENILKHKEEFSFYASRLDELFN